MSKCQQNDVVLSASKCRAVSKIVVLSATIVVLSAKCRFVRKTVSFCQEKNGWYQDPTTEKEAKCWSLSGVQQTRILAASPPDKRPQVHFPRLC